VINGAMCNATVFAPNCTQTQPITNVGGTPNQLIVDEATNTIYVTNGNDDTVSVVDGSHCNGTDTSQCGNTWPVIDVGSSPQGIAFNPITRTLYVANRSDGTVSVINVNLPHCNKGDTSDCTVAATVPVGSSPRLIGVVLDTNTVFVGDRNDLTVSIFDGTTCNGSNVSGCPKTSAPAILVGAFPDTAGNGSNILGRSLAIDQKKHIVFVPNFGDSDIVMLDGNACRAGHLDGCHPKVVDKRMGGKPVMPALDVENGTIYVPNFEDGTVSLLNSPY
jgi:DNA-binding beta-propeller fold protein YncE